MQVGLTVSDRLDEEYDDQRDLSSTNKTCLHTPEWIDSIPQFCLKKRLSDTDEKLMTAQDSLRVAAVRGSIQSAANFNICKINVFILKIVFSANWIDIYYSMGLFCVFFFSYTRS